jgi:hypothetical protein
VDGAGRWFAIAALRGRWFVAEPACEDVAVGRAVSGCPPTHASGSCHLIVPWTVRPDRPRNALRRRGSDPSFRCHLPGVPSVDLPPRVHSRDDRSPDRRIGPGRQPRRVRTRSARVVSHHLGGLLRAQPRIESGACSMNEGASVLQPAADWGSPRFRAGRLDRETLPFRDRGRTAAFPRRSYPPKMPSPAAVPCHHGRCPLAGSALPRTLDGLESAFADLHASVRLEATASFEALIRQRVWATRDRCRSARHPFLPWALFPFEVLRRPQPPEGGIPPAVPRATPKCRLEPPESVRSSKFAVCWTPPPLRARVRRHRRPPWGS